MNTTFWIQLLGVIFGLGMTYFTFVRYKRKELSKSEFLVWQGCWAVLIFVALIPSILDPIIAPLNFYRRLDFFVVVGFFVLLSLCFYNYNSMKRIEKKIEVLVRKEALESKSTENHSPNHDNFKK
ncbi:MAG TPA: DUF2304 domain-containing protein [Candidatus Nanoarchaeia archaeon]|nr:DUF2304 domain-containing protein [Candidatus Nanoarchaeia archaeon]